MNQKWLKHSLLCGAITFFISSAHAASVYWDPNGSSAGVGGTGTWEDTGATTLWNTASDGSGTAQAWTNANNDVAVFGGTGGVVTVSNTVATSYLDIAAGGYNVTGGTIKITPVGNFSSYDLVKFENATSGATLSSAITIDPVNRTSAGNTFFWLLNTTAQTLTVNSNITFNSSGSTSIGRIFCLASTDPNGVIIFDGSVAPADTGKGGVALRIGFGDAGHVTSSTAKYYINGDNSGLTDGNVDITRGIAYVGSANALGGSGKMVRFGNNASSGDTVQLLTNADNLTIANGIQIFGSSSVTMILGGGAVGQTSTYSNNVTFQSTGNGSTVKLTSQSGGRTIFSGTINDGTYTGAIEKIGAGTVVFSKSTGNTYDGGTKISQGLLLAMNTSGSATGTGGVEIASGGVLGGTGFITGLVTASGASGTSHIAPGDGSVGTLTLSGGLTTANGLTLDYDVNGASVDKIDFGTAAVSLDGAITLNFTSLGAVQTGSAYSLLLGSGTWTSGSGLAFIINGPSGYGLDTTYGSGNGYIWDAANHSLTVQFAAIPEPSTAVILGLGLAALLFACAKRRKMALA